MQAFLAIVHTDGASLSLNYEYILLRRGNAICVASANTENQIIGFDDYNDYYPTDFRTLISWCRRYTLYVSRHGAILSDQRYWMNTKENGEPVITLEQVIEKIQNSKTIY